MFTDGSSYLSQKAADLNNQHSVTEQKNWLSQINYLSTEEQLEEEIGPVRPSSLIDGCLLHVVTTSINVALNKEDAASSR